MSTGCWQAPAIRGSGGLRDRGGLESAVARPTATFGGDDLYPHLASKAAALMHSLVSNHPFVEDGNERIGAMAAELFLEINEHRLVASDEDLERVAFSVARGELDSESLAIWLRQRISTEVGSRSRGTESLRQVFGLSRR